MALFLGLVGLGISSLAGLYLVVLLARMVLDWVQVFNRGFRPTGLLLVLANICYALTDPPLRALRRVIPPLRLGQGFALDMGFTVLVLAVIVVQNIGWWIQTFATRLE